MRFGSAALALLLSSAGAGPLAPIHQQRYSMGTMFDIVVYHESSEEAARAMTAALDEVARLDRVMSHYRDDSELARLIREGHGAFVRVDSSLYDVIQESIRFSRLSDGRFDVTVAPLLKAWKAAIAQGRRPTDAEIAAARGCVGYRNLELERPDRIRLRSACVEIDLGGIGKGYAVDRAMAILKAAGITRALVNAGSSSILAAGAPPDRTGWAVALGAPESRSTVLLRDRSLSTSEQGRVALPFAPGTFGEIFDPDAGAPIETTTSVTVASPRATESDALSTTLLLMPQATGRGLLAQFPEASAVWLAGAGTVQAAYGIPLVTASAR